MQEKRPELLYVEIVLSLLKELHIMVSIIIAAKYEAQIFQSTMKLKRATTFGFTTIPTIIFIHYCPTKFQFPFFNNENAILLKPVF